MTPEEQNKVLNKLESPFNDKIKKPLKASAIDILQINVGRKCNLKCKHCHVEAGPERSEEMGKEIFEKCLQILKQYNISTIDITGGAPEMNNHLAWFIKEAAQLKRRLIIRSNLVILLEKKYQHFIDLFAENKVEVVTSLPDYIKDKSDRQRGEGVFEKVVEVMKILNEKGYGKEGSGLVLDIVHNPVGAYLPGSQSAIEFEYHKRLKEQYKVEFNHLFTITNIPNGRFLEYLINSDNYNDYMDDLVGAFNPLAVENVMCKTTLSVSWDGTLYDCDFNQMLNLPVNHGAPNNIMNFDFNKLTHREIITGNHCYGCVAGSGSSCQGAITE